MSIVNRISFVHSALCLACITAMPAVAADVPDSVKKWLGPQMWKRDYDQPVLSLGGEGEFDEVHMMSPTVVRTDDGYAMWYSGSRGFAYDLAPSRIRDERAYDLGYASSDDGIRFEKQPKPRLHLDEARRSFLTPTFLQRADGTLLKFQGKYWMWFCSATLGGGGRPHMVQAATSNDGLRWGDFSDDLLTRAYCPTVIRDGDELRMWYTAPGPYPWVINHARSLDGKKWTVDKEPSLQKSQEWEHYVFNYPVVHKIDDTYLMWYTSYSSDDRTKVAIGFAASDDGIHWHKHPDNPVFRPNEKREWESHYVSSGSVLRMPDGSWRLWYFSRKAPPFKNLYFAFGTARWDAP